MATFIGGVTRVSTAELWEGEGAIKSEMGEIRKGDSKSRGVEANGSLKMADEVRYVMTRDQGRR